jgi:hypothetical protein
MAGFCEHGYEQFGSIKVANYLDRLIMFWKNSRFMELPKALTGYFYATWKAISEAPFRFNLPKKHIYIS